MRIRAVFLLFLPSVYGLQCFICGDNNLDEFGECSTQFPYDCGSYAQRFSPDEKIFCRTTRHKAPNNETYTILKECISETDHYKKFPEKEYSLDEECDLVDIDGKEVAYCICRSRALCNQKPIAEQFMAFEQKHPELFATDESTESVSELRSSPINQEKTAKTAENVAAFGAPQIHPQPILPVNDPRFMKDSREKLPSRERVGETMKDMESAEIDALFRAREATRGKSKENSGTVGRIDAVLPSPPRSSGFVFSTNALDGSMISAKKFEQSPPSDGPQMPSSFGVRQGQKSMISMPNRRPELLGQPLFPPQSSHPRHHQSSDVLNAVKGCCPFVFI